MTEREICRPKTYYGLALDPIHVGTGGYRLGRVDLTVLREPGTHLPKVPGSSLAGSARAYTAMARRRYRRQDDRPKKPTFNPETQQIVEPGEEEIEEQKSYVSCAGKGGKDGSEHCGEMDCPVCVTYGFTIGPQNRSFHGLAQFYDAQVLFFPVHSMVGPVWTTAPGVLAEAGYELPADKMLDGHQVRVASGLVRRPEGNRRWGLNLGWLFLDVAGADLPVDAIWQQLELPDALTTMKKRLVLVPDDLLSLVVDDNLEVRTSVSIDPATGAAEDKALFTYEALPRSTLLRFQVVYHNPQHYVFPAKRGRLVEPTPFPLDRDCGWVEANVVAGLRLMEYLGVGGMNTRGFGRMRVVNLPPEEAKGGAK